LATEILLQEQMNAKQKTVATKKANEKNIKKTDIQVS